MLPPQAQSSFAAARRHSLTSMSPLLRQACASHALRATNAVAVQQSRSFWGWRRQRDDWYSHLDPLYYRFNRFRTIKTRAKLLEKLKRRGKFDWDINQRPFFKSHQIRLASTSKPDWAKELKKQSRRRDEEVEDGYELSPKEKEWKERMEAMRRRVENDPYEAVFGKRFEPFWSPLVPSWMREEMGLQGWPKKQNVKQENSKASEVQEQQPKPGHSSFMTEFNRVGDMLREANTTLKPAPRESSTTSNASSAPPQPKPKSLKQLQEKLEQTHKPIPTPTPEPAQPSSSYSSYTTTSWDSWTNKARRTEWDSVSQKVKRYEYDPVSNRMVLVEGPKAEEPRSLETRESDRYSKSTALEKRSVDMQSLINSPPAAEKALEVPVKEFSNVTLNEQARSPGTTVPSLKSVMNTIVPTTPTKPAALSKLPANDLDMLTADDVRAKMGKTKPAPTAKPSSAEEKAAMEVDFDSKMSSTDAEIEAILLERELAKHKSQADTTKKTTTAEWDKAEKEAFHERELATLKQKKAKLLNDEHGLFHIERRKKELAKLDSRIKQLEQQEVSQEKMLMDAFKTTKAETPDLDKLADTLRHEGKGHGVEGVGKLQTSLDRELAAQDSKALGNTLQSSAERMQTKELPKLNDLDDAAAHESTEPIESASNVPKTWRQQADLLQADRVKRTAAKRPYPYPVKRWIDDMEARKAAYEASKAPSPIEEAAAKAKTERLEKADAMLEAEVKEQKFRMLAHENRYAHKIKSLRGELETAYKQSAVHSEKHVERIRFLEAELEKASKAAGDDVKAAKPITTGNKDEPMREMQGEGDFSPNVTKFAGSGKWYKQPATTPVISKADIEKAEQKARDQALVKEVRDIYEREYGVIDASHRQRVFGGSEKSISADRGPKRQRPTVQAAVKAVKPKRVVEVESDVDLGEALAEHEKSQPGYRFQADGLEAELKSEEKALKEAEIQRLEREAHEAQGLMVAESTKKMERVIANELKPALAAKRAQQAEVEKAAEAKPIAATKPIEHNVKWEEPPVYRVLAYDSGNDMLSAATTTANFTGTETPISIPQALSQLYQPARFVPKFAELQEQGWQVIYGTRDLLVFRKVKSAEASEEAVLESEAEGLALADHGLIKPKENALAQEAAEYYEKYKPAPKEYDPTSTENGKLMPYENAMAQEAANAYDNARPFINPIDGTTKPVPEVSTGNFASPTGFVNHDPVFPPEQQDPKPEWRDQGMDVKHYPRVRRQEPHFSGSRIPGRRHWNERHEWHTRRAERRRERKRGGALKWALSVGLGAAGLCYVVGVAAEMARQEKREKERWESILEGKRSRWD